ncbi:exonuclease mut-7 homolog [Meles meles]|uniref:exonuclease mut-7 homolog n=1 Tax=Meles meles TaxID=9662 RepID=UPI001E69C0C3|nr:exonuclease mut-7 homolog [Meles meles]
MKYFSVYTGCQAGGKDHLDLRAAIPRAPGPGRGWAQHVGGLLLEARQQAEAVLKHLNVRVTPADISSRCKQHQDPTFPPLPPTPAEARRRAAEWEGGDPQSQAAGAVCADPGPPARPHGQRLTQWREVRPRGLSLQLLSRSYCPSHGVIQSPEAAVGKASPHPATHQPPAMPEYPPLKKQREPDPRPVSTLRNAQSHARPRTPPATAHVQTHAQPLCGRVLTGGTPADLRPTPRAQGEAPGPGERTFLDLGAGQELEQGPPGRLPPRSRTSETPGPLACRQWKIRQHPRPGAGGVFTAQRAEALISEGGLSPAAGLYSERGAGGALPAPRRPRPACGFVSLPEAAPGQKEFPEQASVRAVEERSTQALVGRGHRRTGGPPERQEEGSRLGSAPPGPPRPGFPTEAAAPMLRSQAWLLRPDVEPGGHRAVTAVHVSAGTRAYLPASLVSRDLGPPALPQGPAQLTPGALGSLTLSGRTHRKVMKQLVWLGSHREGPSSTGVLPHVVGLALCGGSVVSGPTTALHPEARPGVRWWAALPRATWYLRGLQVEAETGQGKLERFVALLGSRGPWGWGEGLIPSDPRCRWEGQQNPGGLFSHPLASAPWPSPPRPGQLPGISLRSSLGRNPLAASGGHIPGSLLAPGAPAGPLRAVGKCAPGAYLLIAAGGGASPSADLQEAGSAPEEAPGSCARDLPCSWLEAANLQSHAPAIPGSFTRLQLARVPEGVLQWPGPCPFYCHQGCGSGRRPWPSSGQPPLLLRASPGRPTQIFPAHIPERSPGCPTPAHTAAPPPTAESRKEEGALCDPSLRPFVALWGGAPGPGSSELMQRRMGHSCMVRGALSGSGVEGGSPRLARVETPASWSGRGGGVRLLKPARLGSKRRMTRPPEERPACGKDRVAVVTRQSCLWRRPAWSLCPGGQAGPAGDAEGLGLALRERGRPLPRSAPPAKHAPPPPRPRPAPTWAPPNRRAAGARVTGALLLCKYKGGKRRPGAAGGRLQLRVGRRVGPAWEPPQAGTGNARRRRRAHRPSASAVPAPVARPPGRGWMRRGPRGGGPRPPAPGTPRSGVRGPGAPRPPCAEARPETARGPRRSRRRRRRPR